MHDYGRPLAFGISVIPEAARIDAIRAEARAADRAGLDLVGIQDHPYQRRFLDTFALLASLAAETERIHLFPDVANLPLRPAPLLAKAAASIDVISGGRFELGLGAGAFWDAIVAMGGERKTPKQSVDAIEEALMVMQTIWAAEGTANIDGEHYRLHGHHPGPKPPHEIAIWLGARGPRMLGILGRHADGWIPSRSWMPPDELPEFHQRIDDAAHGADRDPADIRRLYNINGTITDGTTGDDVLQGPASQWVDALSSWALESGVDTFIFWPDDPSTVQIERFAHEVAPAVRERVAAARG